MVEGEADEVPEEEVLDAIFFAHRSLVPVLELQERMAKEIGKEKRAFEKKELSDEETARIAGIAAGALADAYAITAKQERHKKIDEVAEAVRESFTEEERPEKAPLIAGGLQEPREEDRPREDPAREEADRRPRPYGHPPDLLRGRRASPDARFRRVHPRRDAGPGRRDAGNEAGRAADRFAAGRHDQGVHAPLQLPALQRRRGEDAPLPGPPRSGARGAGRARGVEGAAAERRLPLHGPRGLRGARVERLLLDGHRVRLLPRDDGRGDPHQRGRLGDRDGADQGRRRVSPSFPTSSGTRTTWATWTSRWRARRTASPPSRWTSRSAASTATSCSPPCGRRARAGCTSSTG